MTQYLLRAGLFRRVWRYLERPWHRAIIRRPKPLEMELGEGASDEVSEEDFELLSCLCAVWIDGPHAQLYYDSPTVELAPHAAREVREAIEGSIIHDCELSLEHIELLRRIEAKLGSTPRGYLAGVVGFLWGILAKARLKIVAIRRALPSKSPSG